MSLLRDGRYYDALHSFMVRDVAYWRACCGPAPLRVLELACGTGRIAIPLAGDGHHVTGIDLEESMIAAATRKPGGDAVTFVRADMRDFACGTFDRVLLPFNGFRLLLERDDVERCLACVRRALAPDGTFALDVTAPDPATLVSRMPVTTHHHRDPHDGSTLVATHERRYDRVRQTITLSATFQLGDGSRTSEELVQRVYFPQELIALLAYNGLDVVEQYGDYDRSPLHAASPQLLLVARAR